jgi:hypothetical protein
MCPKPSAYVGDALLGIGFGRGRWLRWQLKHRCLLTLTQCCQENNAPIRKFERIVVLHRFVLIHLTEDCRRMAKLFHLPPDEAGACNGEIENTSSANSPSPFSKSGMM